MGRTESSAPECVPEVDEFDPIIDDFVSKERNYTHFDLPLSEKKRTNFSITISELKSHPFWPLLGFTKKDRRTKFRDDGTVYYEVKPRAIKFGSHRDAAILESYARELSTKYEALLSQSKFKDSILAYRSGVGSNIHQAGDVFSEIRSRKNCTAIAMDISKFFDRIDHGVLYAALVKVLNTSKMSDSDFHVYKSMTRFSWVEVDDLAAKLGRSTPIGGRLCTPEEFRSLVRPKPDSAVYVNTESFGIPQGTPTSGLFANIAMLEFDRIMWSYLKKRDGSYRRYSDDIAIILPSGGDVPKVLAHVKRRLKFIGLTINDKKTDIVRFHSAPDGKLRGERPFQYLGFTFDGQSTLIRSSSLSRYYGKMKKGIRAKVRAAHTKGIPMDQIFLRQLFKRYTHFGKTRNFPRYAYRAAEILDAPEVRKQLRSHMRFFKRYLRLALAKVYRH